MLDKSNRQISGSHYCIVQWIEIYPVNSIICWTTGAIISPDSLPLSYRRLLGHCTGSCDKHVFMLLLSFVYVYLHWWWSKSFVFFLQASFLNKRLNIEGQRVNIAIWVSLFQGCVSRKIRGSSILWMTLWFLCIGWEFQ